MNYRNQGEKVNRNLVPAIFKRGKVWVGITFVLILTLTLTLFKAQGAIDPPHYDTSTTNPFYCNDCHKERAVAEIPDLCMSCHTDGGRASAKPFARTDQSEIGKKGTTHRFDSEGLKYVKLWQPKNSTGKIKISDGSMYTGDFNTQNEMEYEFEIVAQGDVGTATFKYRCRTRSKPQPANPGAHTESPITKSLNTTIWDRDADWSGWTSTYTTASSVPLNDSICGGNVGISLSFENGSGSPNSFDAGTKGRVYVKKLTSPSNDNMKARVMNNKINCSVCHNQHSMQLDRPYLRANNVGNALCKHCHDDRDRGHYLQVIGEATGGTTISLTDSSKSWTRDQWKDKWVYFQKNFMDIQAPQNIEERTLTGALTFTQNSATVTGSGTLFTTQLTAGVNGEYIRTATSKWYKVSSIESDTSLTLETLFEDATVTGITGKAIKEPYLGFYRKITRNDGVLSGDATNTLYWDCSDNSLPLNCATNNAIEATNKYRIVDTNNYSSHPVGIKYKDAASGGDISDFETRFNSDIKPLPLDDNGTPSDTNDDTVQCMTCHSPHFTHSVGTEGGTATSGTTTSLTDTSKTWTANSLVGYEIKIRNEYDGTGNQNPNWRKRRVITSNTANEVTWLDPINRRSDQNNSSAMIDSPISAETVYEIVNVSGIGDGYILRKPNGYENGYIKKYTVMDDDKVICKTCHKYKNHYGEETVNGYMRSCMDCHTPHNTTNRFLLREVINNREVRLRPGDNYVNSSRTGVCQVCHTQAEHWRNDGTEPIAHYSEGCPQCHNHADEARSWSSGDSLCQSCHGYPPVPIGTIVDKAGNIHTSTTDADCTADNPCVAYNTLSQKIPDSTYRVEDYVGGGGAHLVHVVGQGQLFECSVCHGHLGHGDEHGGSVGRKTPDRNNITFNFQLDYSFNERLETKIGYQTIEPPVYPKFMGTNVGTSATYMNRVDTTAGYGPGKKHIGSGATSNGGNNEDATTPSILGRAVTSSDAPECYVGCHNPRRLYMQTEPESDMIDTAGVGRVDPLENQQRDDPNYGTKYDDIGYGNKFNWTWAWNSSGVLFGSGALPRDENPDVPCAKCHDAQGTLVQGNEDSPSKYKGVNIISAHPPDPAKRTDCRVCHDYNHATKPHKKGTPYLNHKDGGTSIEFDITNPSSLEPFCLTCHDKDGATDGNTATGVPKRPFSKETQSSNEAPDVKTNWTGSAHSANISCFGDGISNGCHGNPHGSGKRALLAPYNDAVGEDQKYFCFNCHGNNPDRLTLAPNIQDQIQKKDVPGQSGHPIPAAGEPWLHKRKEQIIVDKRHSECIDCHDPMADVSTHRLKGQRFVDIDGNPWNPDKDTVSDTHPMIRVAPTTLSGNHTSTVTTITVVSTSNFPSSGSIMIDNEIIDYTGTTATSFTGCTRGKLSSTASDHSSGATVSSYPSYVRQPYVYEVCFRCHGPNYATFFKDYMPFPNVTKDRVGMDGHFSDKRKEFDPRSNQFADYPASGNLGANTAYHPVAVPGRNATDPLYRQLQEAFDLTSANDLKSLTIQCPDCHNNNVLGASGTGLRGPVTYSNRRITDKAPAIINTPNTFSNLNNRQDDKRIGPHGSTNERILRAPYNTNVYYTRQARGSYGTVGAAFGSGGARDNLQLCFLCHKEAVLLETDGGAAGTNFGGTGNGWWTANLHAEHLSASTYSGSEGGQAVCHECHHNVHSNVEAQNTIYGDGLGGMLPPDNEDGILDGVSSTHLLNFAPSVQGATALKPRWYYDGQYYRCDMYCHGANMNYCWYSHGAAGSISQWCEDD